MSLHIVTCTKCGGGNLQIDIKVRYEHRSCPCCHNHKTSDVTFHFCGGDCMVKWLSSQEVAEKGWPCPRCIDYQTGVSTGFSGGFKQNGTCEVCDGTGRFQEAKEKDAACDPEQVALQQAFTKEINEAGGYDAYLKKKAESR